MTDSQLTTFSLGIPAPGQPQPAYMYTLRLGAVDPKVDDHVVYGEGGNYRMAATPNKTDPLGEQGIVLYSYDNLTLFGPNSTYLSSKRKDISEETLTATVKNGLVSNASYSSHGLISTYASAAQMAINASEMVTFNGGNALTVAAGNPAATGIGGLLKSNYGATQNIYGGQIVNMTSSDWTGWSGITGFVMSVQGWGQATLLNEYALAAATSIRFVVDPLVVGAEGSRTGKLADWLKRASILVNFIASTVAGIEAMAIGVTLDTLEAATTDNHDKIKDTMIAAAAASASVSGVIVACQIAAIAAGAAARLAAGSSRGGTVPSFEMTNALITLAANATNSIEVSGAGTIISALPSTTTEITQDQIWIISPRIGIDSPESITLSCGNSSIVLLPELIQIRGTAVQVNGANVATV